MIIKFVFLSSLLIFIVIRSNITSMKPKNKAKNLLSQTPEAYYWLGFLMADGHFSDNNRLTISLSIKDENHLKKLILFMGNAHMTYYKIKHGEQYCRYSVMDKIAINELKQKFNIVSNKTENPPDIKIYASMPDELFLSFLIGFIDGDGRITYQSGRSDCFIDIKIHGSWLNNLIVMKNRLENILKTNIPQPKINKYGYAFIVFSKMSVYRFLKQTAIDLKLPFLERKWNKIDENRISRYEISQKNTILVKDLLNKMMTGPAICKKTGLKLTTVYSIKKRILHHFA